MPFQNNRQNNNLVADTNFSQAQDTLTIIIIIIIILTITHLRCSHDIVVWGTVEPYSRTACIQRAVKMC